MKLYIKLILACFLLPTLTTEKTYTSAEEEDAIAPKSEDKSAFDSAKDFAKKHWENFKSHAKKLGSHIADGARSAGKAVHKFFTSDTGGLKIGLRKIGIMKPKEEVPSQAETGGGSSFSTETSTTSKQPPNI